jgi:hypothetical protein
MSYPPFKGYYFLIVIASERRDLHLKSLRYLTKKVSANTKAGDCRALDGRSQ